MADVRYTVTDLGVLPGYAYSSAEAINDTGQIIGSLRAKDASDSDAFWWEDGRMQRVGGLSLNAINNRGVAVGTEFRIIKDRPSFRAISFQAGRLRVYVKTAVPALKGRATAKRSLMNEAEDTEDQPASAGFPWP